MSWARATQPGVGAPVAHAGPTWLRSLMSYEKVRSEVLAVNTRTFRSVGIA